MSEAYPVWTIDNYLSADNAQRSLVKVDDEMMQAAGLRKGDLVVMERRAKIETGAIVVALVGDGYVVRYLDRAAGAAHLRDGHGNASNPVPHVAGAVVAIIRPPKK